MIYKLRFDRERFLVFEISPDEIEMGLDDYFLLREPLWSDFWKPINGRFHDFSDYKNVTTVPDISCWFTEQLVLNETAYEKLSDTLSSYGEFLPVKCEGVPYWILHVTKLTGMEAIDEDNSERIIEESGYKDVQQLAFREEAVKGLLLFKSEYNDYANIYCNDEFKQLIEEDGLQGLVFNPDLAGVF